MPKRLLLPSRPLGLLVALSLAGCVNLPDQQLANQALKRGDTAQAQSNYQQLADLGFVDAKVGLADIQVQSRDPEQIRQAEITYRSALDDSPRAQARLGRLLVLKPHASDADRHEAQGLLQRAMASSESGALTSLAMLYLQFPKTFPEVDAQQKINAWRAAGYPEAGLAQIMLYRVRNTYDQHLDEIEATCRHLLGRMEVCYNELATVYQKRKQADHLAALLKQLQNAYAHHQVLADRIDSVAQVLADPDVGTPDVKTAQAMFEQVAPVFPASWVSLAQLAYDNPELGGLEQIMAYLDKGRAAALPRAELLTGRIYYEGKLMVPQPQVALQHFRKASATEISAYYYIGLIYRRGYLGYPDPQQASDNLLIAARGGQTNADMALAQLYSSGRGTRPNLINAYVFAQLAVAEAQVLAQRTGEPLAPQPAALAAAIEQQLPLDKRAQAQQLLEREQRLRGVQMPSNVLALQALPAEEVGKDPAL